MSGLKYTLVVTHPESLTAVALLQGEPVPEWASELVHSDDLESSDHEGGSKPPTNPELEAEIAKRNEGRAETDQIVPAGKTKADLVAALEADAK